MECVSYDNLSPLYTQTYIYGMYSTTRIIEFLTTNAFLEEVNWHMQVSYKYNTVRSCMFLFGKSPII